MKILRFVFRGILFMTIALAIAGGLLVFQMSNGSLSVGFLKKQFVAAIEPRLPPGSDFSIDDLLLAFGPDWSLIAESRGASVSIKDRGHMDADEIRVVLETLPLLKGSFVPHSIDINRLSLNLDRQPTADLSGQRADIVRSLLTRLAVTVAGADRRLTDLGLRRIRLVDVRVSGDAFEASVFSEKPIQISTIVWKTSDDGGEVNTEFLSDHGRWRLAISSGIDPEGGTFADLKITDFPPAFLVPRIADPQRRPYFDAKADIEGRILVDSEGRLNAARTHFALGSGYLSILEHDANIIDRIDVALELPADGDRVDIARSDVRFGDSHVVFRGGIDLAAFGEPMRFDAELGKTRLESSGDRIEPVLLESGSASGSFDVSQGIIRLDSAFISGPEGAARVVGAFRASGLGPGLSGAVTIEETTARMLRALWLPIIARKTRSWFDQNVKSGLLGPGSVQIALPLENLGRAGRDRLLPEDGVVGEIPYRYGLFTPLPDLPLVRNAFGSLEFRDATAIVKLARADVTAAGLGVADVRDTVFSIPNLGKPDPIGLLDLNVSGPAAALAGLSNMGRLNIAEERGLSPEDLTGDAVLDLKAGMSLKARANPDDFAAEFKLVLSDFASKAAIAGQKISKGDLAVSGNIDSFKISGNAHIDGIPAKIDVVSGGGANQSTVRLEMDEKARKTLGIDLGAYLTGNIITSITPQAGGKVQQISVDLEAARINMPFLGWQKGSGVPATIEAQVERTAIGTEFRNILMTGNGFRADGEVEIDADGKLTSLKMNNISLKPGDDFSITADKTGSGYKISMSGSSFDARGLIGQLQPGSPGEAPDQKYSVSFNLGQVRGYNGIVLSGLTGSALASAGQVRNMSLQAGSGSAQPIEFMVSEDGNVRSLELRSANGGALLRFLNLYDKAFGGDLLLKFSGQKGRSDGTGLLTIANFRVQNEQIFDAAAAERERKSNPDREIRSTDVNIDTTNISFAKLKVPFSKHGSVIVISDGSLHGPVVGASGKGTIDLSAENLSLSGTIVPAYGINNLPGAIPILGQLLGGRKREGLIGITYQLFGPISAPTLKMNPASAIAPGIFRRIFEFR